METGKRTPRELEELIVELREGMMPEFHGQFDALVAEARKKGPEKLEENLETVKALGPKLCGQHLFTLRDNLSYS